MIRTIIRSSIFFLSLTILFPLQLDSESSTIRFETKKTECKLKILTWNIYMLPHCSWLKGNCNRAAEIAEKLKSSDYDIIVFEEAFDFRARRILQKQLMGSFPFMYGPANLSFFSLKTSSGIWVVSKIPLKKIREIEYHNRYGIDAMARKGAVMFQGEWKGNDFQLIGTHLQADSPDQVRREQCGEIYRTLLKKYSRHNVPQFVCGDFNIEMQDSTNYQFMLKTLDAENGNMDGDIHTSFDEIDNTLAQKPHGKKWLIDYILVRNSQLIQNIHRKVSIFHGQHQNKATDLSDHYAIEATIDFGIIPAYTATIK